MQWTVLVKYHPFLTTSFVYIWFYIVKQYKNTQVETFLMHPTFSSKGGFRIAINGITIYQVEKKKNQILPWIWDIGCFKQRQWYLAKMVLHVSHHDFKKKTLPKALRTQALTASTSSFGLILWVGFGRFGLVSLVVLAWQVWFGLVW